MCIHPRVTYTFTSRASTLCGHASVSLCLCAMVCVVCVGGGAERAARPWPWRRPSRVRAATHLCAALSVQRHTPSQPYKLTPKEAAELVVGLLFAAHKNPGIGAAQTLTYILDRKHRYVHLRVPFVATAQPACTRPRVPSAGLRAVGAGWCAPLAVGYGGQRLPN